MLTENEQDKVAEAWSEWLIELHHREHDRALRGSQPEPEQELGSDGGHRYYFFSGIENRTRRGTEIEFCCLLANFFFGNQCDKGIIVVKLGVFCSRTICDVRAALIIGDFL
jgi:hypothetical protein